jgi:hypothetical protein
MIEEVEFLSGKEPSQSGSLSMYGFHILHGHGFETFFADLAKRVTSVFVRPHHPVLTAECSAAFVVRYRAGVDAGHMPHEDNSDITLNACLGKEFVGGMLGLARNPAVVREVLGRVRQVLPVGGAAEKITDIMPPFLYSMYRQNPGQALVHAGSATHGAEPLTAGERLNLIVWFRLVWPPGPPGLASFASLPDDVLPLVLAHMGVHDVLRAGAVCQRLRAAALANDLWQQLWQARPPVTLELVSQAFFSPSPPERRPVPVPGACTSPGQVKVLYLQALRAERAATAPLVARSLRLMSMVKRMAPPSAEAAHRERMSDAVSAALSTLDMHTICALEPTDSRPPVYAVPSMFPATVAAADEDVDVLAAKFVRTYGLQVLGVRPHLSDPFGSAFAPTPIAPGMSALSYGGMPMDAPPMPPGMPSATPIAWVGLPVLAMGMPPMKPMPPGMPPKLTPAARSKPSAPTAQPAKAAKGTLPFAE